jgi:hypothetical protein
MGTYNTRVIPAPVDAVWQTLRNFHDMSWAKGVIDDLAVVGKRGADQIGAKRVLNGVFHETLLGLDDEDHEVLYSIDDGPGVMAKDKVRGYRGRIRVRPVTDRDHTFVEWSSSWQGSAGGVFDFCDPIYKALLDTLARRFS